LSISHRVYILLFLLYFIHCGPVMSLISTYAERERVLSLIQQCNLSLEYRVAMHCIIA
jgi:hypothetical protein